MNLHEFLFVEIRVRLTLTLLLRAGFLCKMRSRCNGSRQ